MATIEPRFEAYGSYLHATYIADFVEVAALRGALVTRATLSNHLEDVGLAAPPPTQLAVFSMEEESEDAEDTIDGDAHAQLPASIECPSDEHADTYAELIFSILNERQELLGERYPFAINRNTLEVVQERSNGAYRLLLEMTMAHVHADDSLKRRIREHFENIVQRYLCSYRLHVQEITRNRSRTGSYSERVANVLRALDRPRTLPGIMVPRRANDGGTDYLATLPIGDFRTSVVALAVQVTCAKSDRWKEKFNEPHCIKWGRLLSSHVNPAPALAVPHHVESDFLRELEEHAGGIVLDRLLLSRGLAEITEADQPLLTEATSLKYALP